MNLIEQLEKLPRWDKYRNIDPRGEFVKADDLRAIIEQEKSKISEGLKNSQAEREAVEPLDYVHNMPGCSGFTVCVFKADRVPCGTPIYLSQPDHTKLIGELVEALESFDIFDDFAELYHLKKNVDIDALLTKAREAIK